MNFMMHNKKVKKKQREQTLFVNNQQCLFTTKINVNNCKNLIPCSEKEHQLNRRTEFRVVGKVGEADFIEKSQPNANPRTDVCVGCPF